MLPLSSIWNNYPIWLAKGDRFFSHRLLSLKDSLSWACSNTTSQKHVIHQRKEEPFVMHHTSCLVMSESEYLLLVQEDMVPPFFLNRISVLMRGYSAALTAQISSHNLSLRRLRLSIKITYAKNWPANLCWTRNHFLTSPWSALCPYFIVSLSLQSSPNVFKLRGIQL